jgi:hypothetical protein
MVCGWKAPRIADGRRGRGLGRPGLLHGSAFFTDSIRSIGPPPLEQSRSGSVTSGSRAHGRYVISMDGLLAVSKNVRSAASYRVHGAVPRFVQIFIRNSLRTLH